MSRNALGFLVDSRGVNNRQYQFHIAKSRGAWVKVCQYFYFPKDQWGQLKPYQQQRVRAVGIGRSVHKAVIVSRSALDLHGLWVIAKTPHDVELALPNGRIPPRKQWLPHVRYRSTALPPDHIVEKDGVRLVKEARAVVDVARYCGFREGLVAADSYMRRNMWGKEDLLTVLEQMGRIKGASTVRQVIKHSDAASESPYESLARAILIESGFERIRMQVSPVRGIRVDLMVANVVVEVDGAVKYDGESFGKPTDQVLRMEREREKLLRNHGFEVVRVSPRQLLQSPELLVEWVQLAQRRAA